MVRGIQTQDFLNILNKNSNAKIAISQTNETTNASVGKLVLGTLNTNDASTTATSQSSPATTIQGDRLENSDRIIKNGQLIIKNVGDKGHSVLIVTNASSNDTTTASVAATSLAVSQSDTQMSIETLETMEANSNEDNESNVTTAPSHKIAPLLGSGK
jgi:NaMN:DMB phosphoribosyltransferase